MTTKTKRGSFIEWIDVNERKPNDPNPWVLACCRISPKSQYVREVRYSVRTGRFYIDADPDRIFNITHWAELPPPFPESQIVEECPPQPDPEPAQLNWVSSTDEDGNTVWEALSSFSSGDDIFYWRLRQAIQGDRILWIESHDSDLEGLNESWTTAAVAKLAIESYDREQAADYAEVETATVVVPVEPTGHMVANGRLALVNPNQPSKVCAIWQAMLDAAPKT